MKNAKNMNVRNTLVKAIVFGWALTVILSVCLFPISKTEASVSNQALEQFYQRSAPSFDLNLSRNVQNLRQATGAQLSALENFKAANNVPNVKIRFNEFSGSIDAIYDFASASFAGTPEEAGRAFLQQNAALFGLSDVNSIQLFSARQALGGHLLRFQQNFNSVPVKDGGIGLVLNANKQVIMASGPFFRDVNINTAPDTLVKARDAMIVADQLLYSTDTTDPDAPGKHRAMIEQIFAARELGVNALEVSGGKATISTQVTPFVGDQAAPQVPSNVQVVPATTRTNRISWNGVSGAVSYEILKRQDGFENARQPNGRRIFADGDASTTGFRHVAFVNGNQLSYEDKGAVHEVFAPEGLKIFSTTNTLFAPSVLIRRDKSVSRTFPARRNRLLCVRV